MKYFDAIKLLFPRSRAFELFIKSIKRKIVKAFSVLPEDIRYNAESVYTDLFPDTTRFPEKWEKTFAVYFTAQELSKRRAVIDALWKINMGGQSTAYLEQILQSIHGDIKVYDNIPAIDPRGIRLVRIAVCNYRTMVCGNKYAVCDARIGTLQSVPTILRNDASEIYLLPDEKEYWEMCFFVCKNIMKAGNKILYAERLKINIKWKNFIEYLILRIKPVHTTAIMYIEWQEGEEYD